MKATAWIAAAALSFGTAAFAAQSHSDDKAARGEENARVEQQDHGSANEKMRNGMHRIGEKTRHAFHRMGEKMHHVAHNDRSNDTRAMGASGASGQDRQARMDEAYSRWQARHDKAEHTSSSR